VIIIVLYFSEKTKTHENETYSKVQKEFFMSLLEKWRDCPNFHIYLIQLMQFLRTCPKLAILRSFEYQLTSILDRIYRDHYQSVESLFNSPRFVEEIDTFKDKIQKFNQLTHVLIHSQFGFHGNIARKIVRNIFADVKGLCERADRRIEWANKKREEMKRKKV